MKKKIILAAMLISMTSTVFSFRFPLQFTIREFGKHLNHRDDPAYSYLPSVVYNDEEATLSLESNVDLGTIPYVIIDESGDEVLSGYVTVLHDTVSTISVASLPAGDYTVLIEVNDVEFGADLSI
mgnify:CR=1 FL=1